MAGRDEVVVGGIFGGANVGVEVAGRDEEVVGGIFDEVVVVGGVLVVAGKEVVGVMFCIGARGFGGGEVEITLGGIIFGGGPGSKGAEINSSVGTNESVEDAN